MHRPVWKKGEIIYALHRSIQRTGTLKGRKLLRMVRVAQQHKGLCEGDCERGNYLCIAEWRQDYILSLFWFLIRAISIKIILEVNGR